MSVVNSVSPANTHGKIMKGMCHVILTRFNLKSAFGDPKTRLDPAWLHHRFDLFDRFCFPSVRGQSNQNFKWLVLFGSDTPENFKAKVAGYTNWDNFIPLYLDMTGSIEEYSAMIRQVVRSMAAGAGGLITTRLDNDDAIHRDFVQILQSNIKEGGTEFINFTDGYIWHKSKLYLTAQRSNPFISLVETGHHFKTVYCEVEHNLLSTVAPIREIRTVPLWLQVIHEKNVINRVQGARTPIKGLQNFAIEGALIPSQNDWLSCVIERGQYVFNRAVKKAFRR